jgi:hypothetical protein
MPDIKYKGWIREDIGSRKDLIFYGVRGDIEYYRRGRTFINCVITEEVAERLSKINKHFFPGAFSAIDENGNQLPKEQQKLWGKMSRDFYEKERTAKSCP